MIELCPVGRGRTPDEVATVGALLMGPDGAFITGSDVLMDGGVTASYFFGELAHSDRSSRWSSLPRLRWINGARRSGRAERLVVGWSGMRGSRPSGSMNRKVKHGNALHPVHGPWNGPETANALHPVHGPRRVVLRQRTDHHFRWSTA
jgi:hypothetical protein